jgi:dipeptidyl-peptidase 4
MTSRSRILAFALILLAVRLSVAAESVPPGLTVEGIFSSTGFDDQSFSAQWLDDGSAYVTVEKAEGGSGQDIVAWDPETGERTVLVPASQLTPGPESSPLVIDGFQFSSDRSLVLIYTNSQRVWRQKTRGDYWVLDRSARTLHQLGGDARPASLMFAKLSPTGRYVAYVRRSENGTGSGSGACPISGAENGTGSGSGMSGACPISGAENGTGSGSGTSGACPIFHNIYLEDLLTRQIVPLTTDGSADVINGTFDWVHEEEFGLRDGFRWSPDGTAIAYWQLDTSGVPEFTMIDNTSGLYPRLQQFKYPKVGQQNATSRLGVVHIADRQTRWVDIPGHSRDHYLPRMQWAGNSTELLVQHMNRLQNTNDVLLADLDSGQVTKLLREQDEAWIDIHDELFWLDDGRRFTWISERDGWRRVYLVSRTGETQRVTRDDWDVIELLHADARRDELYFLASPHNPTQRYLYRARLDGSPAQRITPDAQSGTHQYDISPDGRWAIHRWSSFDTPPRIELVRLPEHETVRVLVDNQKLVERLQALKLAPAEFFRVDIGGGVELDGFCLKPSNLDPQKRYPLLIFVYGEPAGQTVLDRWGGKNQLWHRMLAEQGYVVMSFDNRGTPAPRGRDWRKVVYRQVGILAAVEQAAALEKVLAERPYLDPQRVGIWGWSGGGSMALNAIFKYPRLYHTAMSVAPVPNQRYYDTIYQERYMGLPDDNVDGYMQGSAINFAKQLEGNLLVVHGTADDNVHYQITEMLIDELIRNNKRFTMMAYPNRSHAIREGANTTRHLRELLTGYLTSHLPPGPSEIPDDSPQ